MSSRPKDPVPVDMTPLTTGDHWAVCACCHRKPRRANRVPLAVWFGKATFQAPAICLCAVCLTSALFKLGFRDTASFADIRDFRKREVH